MMTNLSFTYQDRVIRTAGTADAPLFVAADVCAVLGLSNPSEALRPIPDAEKGTLRISEGGPEVNVLHEAGLYRLIFRSNKPEAETFRVWVFNEVLPAIRKTGRYETPTMPDLSDSIVMATMLQDATARFIESETARREAQQQLAAQAPAVAFARQVELSPVDINIGTFAKAIGWGPNKLHEELRRRGYMFRRDGHPVPKQTYVEQGLFTVKEVPKGDRVFPVTTITGKGQVRIARELGIAPQPASLELASTASI